MALVRYALAWFDLHRAMDEEEGQGLVEYALIIVLIAIAAIVALGTLSGSINGVFDSISGSLDSGVSGG